MDHTPTPTPTTDDDSDNDGNTSPLNPFDDLPQEDNSKKVSNNSNTIDNNQSNDHSTDENDNSDNNNKFIPNNNSSHNNHNLTHELQQLFNTFDKNRDGIISLDELQLVLNALGLDPILEESLALIQYASTLPLKTTMTKNEQQLQRNGITIEQFVSIVSSALSPQSSSSSSPSPLPQSSSASSSSSSSNPSNQSSPSSSSTTASTTPMTTSDIKNVFSVFDRDGDGYITFSDLKQLTMVLDMSLSDQELRLMIDRADVDGDSLVSCEEFLRFVAS